MFHWNEAGGKSDELFTNLENISKISIAMAYISDFGFELLKNLIKRFGLHLKDVKLYISRDFSTVSPAELLCKLQETCTVKVIVQEGFHPKVYYFKARDGKNTLIFGSSNFTENGFHKNVEFNTQMELTGKERTQIEGFFAYCEKLAVPVDEEMILRYKKIESEIAVLMKDQDDAKNIFRKNLKIYQNGGDKMTVDHGKSNNYYYQADDYAVFSSKYQTRTDAETRLRRENVKEKMMKIHKSIYEKDIKEMGLACHSRKANITSATYPNMFNRYHVSWLTLRYSKATVESAEAKYQGPCLQFLIAEEGLEINLFFAVTSTPKKRRELSVKQWPGIEKELMGLKNNKMKWIITNSREDIENDIFDLDSRNIQEFFGFFTKYDCKGRESYLSLRYNPDDVRMMTKEGIEQEIVEKFHILLPLYHQLA